jgi:hypothetical protein
MTRRLATWATSLFTFLLTLTIVVYILRGLAILAMMPGGVIWALILMTIASGLLAALLKTR